MSGRRIDGVHSGQPVVSIVVPVWNEIESLPSLLTALASLEKELAELGCVMEVVITDNASTDGSWELLTASSLPQRTRAFQFTRNFGFQESILFALSKTTGDCAVVLQSDLQDPPELIPEFVKRWQEGALTVAGRATERVDGAVMGLMRKAFYALASGASEAPVSRGVQDFYLLDRRVLNDLVQSKPPIQLIRTYVAEYFGFAATIDYSRRERVHGTASLSLRDYYALAMDGLLLSGGRAIRYLTIASFMLASIASTAAIALAIAYIIGWRPTVVGWLSLFLAFLLLSAVTGTTMGIALEYLRRIARLTQPGPRAQCWAVHESPAVPLTHNSPRSAN